MPFWHISQSQDEGRAKAKVAEIQNEKLGKPAYQRVRLLTNPIILVRFVFW